MKKIKSNSNFYTGIHVIENFQGMNELHKNNRYSLSELEGALYPNQCVVLKLGQQQSALAVVKGDNLIKIDQDKSYFGVHPRNKEQIFAMHLLNDDSINLKILTGLEGVGKNHITAAVILDKILNQKKYDKLILTKTTDEVGRSLGLFPGTADEKFSNYMLSFRYTFLNLMGKTDDYFEMAMDKKIIEYIPIQLMRGISFPERTLIWADEVAGLSPYELRMLGTRLGKDCTLVLTGSFEQIDRKLKKEETGLFKLINNENILNSNLSSSIELIKNERSELSKLISESL